MYFSFPFLLTFFYISSLHSFWHFKLVLVLRNIWCLIKTPSTHCTQTIFQGGSPWATLILNSMIVVGVLYCVQLFFGDENYPKLCSPFLCYSLFFQFPSSILLYCSICIISQNMGCLMKTPLKHCTQTIFQRGSPWATLILNSMIVVVVLYCVQLFFRDDPFQNDFILSFAIAFVFLVS